MTNKDFVGVTIVFEYEGRLNRNLDGYIHFLANQIGAELNGSGCLLPNGPRDLSFGIKLHPDILTDNDYLEE